MPPLANSDHSLDIDGDTKCTADYLKFCMDIAEKTNKLQMTKKLLKALHLF